MASDEPLLAGVAGRYAAALYDLAKDERSVVEVEKDLSKFTALCSESPDFQRMIKSPVIAAEDQGNALTSILSKVGVHTITLNFFKLLAKNRRLFVGPDIVSAFHALAAKARGEVVAEVTSAIPLSESHVADLRKALSAHLGKEIKLVQKVNLSILGGLIVKLGSRMIDSSLKTKLDNLKISLKGSA